MPTKHFAWLFCSTVAGLLFGCTIAPVAQVVPVSQALPAAQSAQAVSISPISKEATTEAQSTGGRR